MLDPGLVLTDRYRLDERLATGGMGEVWRATDLVLGRTVAVKVLLPGLLADAGFAARFRGEARMMAALRHRGIVQVYDYGESADAAGRVVVYLVMAYVDGEPLSARIEAAGRLPVREIMSIVAQAADALEPVHAVGIVHRDVKPANLLVQPDGSVVLVDFGVAHDATATRLTGTDMVLGTALYMAPEQVSGLPVSAATDIYALGAVAYHGLAGEPPFTGGTALAVAIRHRHDEPPPLPADVPAAVRAVVGRALAKEPGDRYPSAAAFAAAVRAALSGTAAGAAGGALEPDTLTDLAAVPASRARSRGRLAALAVAGVIVLFAVVAWAAMLRPTSRAGTPSPSSSAPPAATASSPAATSRPSPTRQSTAPTPSRAPSATTPSASPSQPASPPASRASPPASASASPAG
jgi:serine/threonine-protein kinase